MARKLVIEFELGCSDLPDYLDCFESLQAGVLDCSNRLVATRSQNGYLRLIAVRTVVKVFHR